MASNSVTLTAKNSTQPSALGSVHHGLGPLYSVRPDRHYTGLFGGGPSQAVWSLDEVQDSLVAGTVDRLDGSTKLRFIAYTRLERLEAELADNPTALACSLSPAALARGLLVGEMREMCKRHNIEINRSDIKASLQEKLLLHECSPTCGEHISLFVPIDHGGKGDLQEKVIAKGFTLSDIREWVDDDETLRMPDTAALTLAKLVRERDLIEKGFVEPGFLFVRMPWTALLPRLTKAGIQEIGHLHGLQIPARRSRTQGLQELRDHECGVNCTTIIPAFVLQRQRNQKPLPPDDDKPFVWEELKPQVDGSYPPKPINKKDVARCVGQYTDALQIPMIEEVPCISCAQLIRSADALPFERTKYSLSILEQRSVAVLERTSPREEIQPLRGPIMLQNSNAICGPCHTSLSKGKMPLLALANGLWIGEVPNELKDLTLGERALIARVRRNRTLVRISSGHYKMIANVIAFPNPTIKVYEKLPPHRSDIDDVLAVIFTGVSPPTDDDLKRTPVMVRRMKVLRALEWLKMNHCDYYDLDIDQEALESYPEEGVPVGVLHREISDEHGNVPSTAKAVFDDGEERGAEDGPCPFTVHGLTTTKFSTMTPNSRKVAVVQHLNDGGGALAVGHGEKPESIYDNATLYPRMFPWLFPYGRGSPGTADLFRKVSESRHRQWLLNYHDKRFQMDSHFLVTAFNHQQIKDSTAGSFVMIKRRNFEEVARTIREINPGVLANISRNMREGIRFSPSTDQEKKSYRLLEHIEYVGGHVDGSMARRKYMRNELWSLISFQGAPSWFVTISPSDNRHPLCIFWAGESLTYKPEVLNSSDRERRITSNPVACAKFFHFVIELFLTHIVGWGQEHRGVFGDPAAYYGTVEQQGRMTLHLHILLFVKGALSPKDIREKLVNGDGEFERKLIEYLESVQTGDFLTGTKEEVRRRIPRDTLPKKKGIHTILHEDEGQVSHDPNYRDPTLNFPRAPPMVLCEDDDLCGCENCLDIEDWYVNFKETVDDIMYRTNVHVCTAKKGVTGGVFPQHPTGKGCVGKDGKCAARFPRKVVEESHVDPIDGHISLKKLESSLNCVTPAVTYTNCCNTDTTSLQSGTGIKATVGYVCDYLTKMSLKTHQIFSTMYDAFERHSNTLFSQDAKTVDSARKMILRVVNSLGAKTEIGAPMAALYLLDNPDKYCSHEFVSFYWKNYINYVRREWDKLLDRMEVDEENEAAQLEVENVDTYDDGEREAEHQPLSAEDNEPVILRRSASYFISRSSVDDYLYRPKQLEDVSVYEWVQCSVREKSNFARAGLRFFTYLDGHSMATKQKVACDPERRKFVVPNFIGPRLPRDDEDGDREEYCLTMLALFKPWRTGIDLKTANHTWEEAFSLHKFSERQKEIMRNFKVRFECYDARDDFHAQRKADHANGADIEDLEGEGSDVGDLDLDSNIVKDDSYWLAKTVKGTWTKDQDKRWREAEEALKGARWNMGGSGNYSGLNIEPVSVGTGMDGAYWTDLIKREKARLWKERFNRLTGPGDDDDGRERKKEIKPVVNDVRVVYGPYYSRSFQPSNPRWVDVMGDIEKAYSLNAEQSRSFRIVANHATLIEPDQLLKYLGGMAGTGKTQVLKSLIAFFKARGEPYRLVLLGPTGTSAALIGGTTYHSFLSIVSGKWGSNKVELRAVEEVRERLLGVGYIFIDEISMLSCLDVCRISERLCDAMNMHEKPFGGLNVIFAGDFAQLPPIKGHALYSGDVSLKQTPRQKIEDQEETIGKSIWLQFTCCVILKKNMRQRDETEDDIKFRKALENLRYRACTNDDIAFLKTRIPAYNEKISLDDPKFRFVSIITSRNVQKDTFNFYNTARFSEEAGKELHDFYSLDSLSQTQSNGDFQADEVGSSKVDPRLQQILWDQIPSTSEQVPARLSLCIGMPVMIRNNEATDLCITRGQEATVVGWKSTPIKGFPNKRSLDTLFVRLVNPPRRVKIPGLPEMVVPLTKTSQQVIAKLPNGDAPKISRKQIPILPNFAMTDYASQGKTRTFNVVDLTMCRSHQAIYTCLSRGKTAADTIIVRDFPSHMMQGGIFGWLRQEFRELNYLDKITELRYEGKLPDEIVKPTRWATIDGYKKWSKDNDEETWHPVLRAEPRRDEWQRPVRDSQVHLFKRKLSAKRKAPEELANEVTKRQRTGQHRYWGFEDQVPIGPIWDSANWSCAFDSWIFVLFQLWWLDRYRWADQLAPLSRSFRLLSSEFPMTQMCEEADVGISRVRDHWRNLIWETAYDPGAFPRGPFGSDICSLSRLLWGLGGVISNSTLQCTSCDYWTEVRGEFGLSPFMILHESPNPNIQSEIARRAGAQGECPNCGRDIAYKRTMGSLWCMQISGVGPVTIQPIVNLPSGEEFRIFAAIYHGHSHFVARVVSDAGDVFFHDGMEGAKSKWEANPPRTVAAIMSRNTRSSTRAQEASASQIGCIPKKEESDDESVHSLAPRGGRVLLAKRKDDKRALSRLQKRLNKARVAKVNGKRKRNNLRERLKHVTERLKEVDETLRDLTQIVETAKEVCDKAKGVIEEELNDVIIYRSDDSECVGSDDELSDAD